LPLRELRARRRVWGVGWSPCADACVCAFAELPVSAHEDAIHDSRVMVHKP
jgi:hypothetical protein